MRLRVFALAIATVGTAACSLVLEPVAHRSHDGSVTVDSANDSGVTVDANRSDAADGALPIDVPRPDAIQSDAIVVDAVEIDAIVVDATDGHVIDAVDVPTLDAPPPDAPHRDATPIDSSRVDAVDTPDPSADAIALRDVSSPPSDGAVPCVTDGDCVPFWCGCGMCPSADAFSCESPTTGCPLGCSTTFCPYAMNVSCACVGGFCQRSIGSNPVGASCTTAAECEPGLSCCACGAAGCPSSCVAVDPLAGCATVM